MSDARTTLTGGCHCGEMTVAFETSIDPHTLPLRACQCTFCRRHGAVMTSDPAGRLVVEVRAPERLQRYRFALRITDFLICRACGTFVAAITEIEGRTLGVLNVNALDEQGAFARPPSPVVFGAERVEERVARRAKGWTAVEVKLS